MIRPVPCLVLAALLPALAEAAVPVVEERSSTGAANPAPATVMAATADDAAPAPAEAAAASNLDLFGPPLTDDSPIDGSTVRPGGRTLGLTGATDTEAGELVYQVQVLREEVLELRGLVEEQAYRLDRLAGEQQARYQDLDRRVAALVTGAVAPADGATAGGGELTAPDAAPALPGERDAYTQAFNLTRERQFPEAIVAFEQLLAQYPDGRFAGNAFYWLGELHLAVAEPDLEQSRQAFAQVVNLYPSHPKVPDALYKLGVVYHQLGDRDRAAGFLQQVLELHPGTTAARLADTYRSQMGG